MPGRYFVPDFRPALEFESPDGDPAGDGKLEDGRPFVCRTVTFEGYALGYYWFDATGLEAAGIDDIVRLLNESRIAVDTSRPEVSVEGRVTRDARGRPVWEIVVAWDPVW